MVQTRSNLTGYLLAAALGAVGGGFLVAALTRAIPKMMASIMSQMMPGMMQNMRGMLKECGCSPDN
jgi:hypothetical protein